MPGWSEHDDERLIAGWRYGATERLAQQLNRTRNAIIGRAHRLGLPIIQKTGPWKRKPVTPTVHRDAFRIKPKRKRKPMLKPKPIPPKITSANVWTWAANKTHILDIRDGQCRWPIDTTDCCGGSVSEAGRPYCDVHHAVAVARRP